MCRLIFTVDNSIDKKNQCIHIFIYVSTMSTLYLYNLVINIYAIYIGILYTYIYLVGFIGK